MSSPDTTQAEREEQRLQSLLGVAGKRPEPAEQQRQEWENLFRREIGKVVASRRQRQRIAIAVAAAAVVAVVGLLLLVQPQSQPAVLVAEVVSARNGNESHLDGRRVGPLINGSAINVGQSVRTESDGTLALTYRGADLRLKGDTKVRFHIAHIELIAGAVYVDTDIGTAPMALPVIIATELATFSHMGTQFMVAVEQDRAITAAVRVGTMVLRTNGVQQKYAATDHSAEVVRISSSGGIDTERVSRHGPLWQWVTEAAPGKVIDALSADEILRWIARETGNRLTYADDETARVARQNTIRAPDQPMSPARALSLLNATTSLHAVETGPQGLVVSRARSEGDQDADGRDTR